MSCFEAVSDAEKSHYTLGICIGLYEHTTLRDFYEG
jgi:hypothetical protein